MSEDSNKPPSINLEELERQLREALSRRTAPTDAAHDGAGNEDPLSMLARLVPSVTTTGKSAQHKPSSEMQTKSVQVRTLKTLAAEISIN